VLGATLGHVKGTQRAFLFTKPRPEVGDSTRA